MYNKYTLCMQMYTFCWSLHVSFWKKEGSFCLSACPGKCERYVPNINVDVGEEEGGEGDAWTVGYEFIMNNGRTFAGTQRSRALVTHGQRRRITTRSRRYVGSFVEIPVARRRPSSSWLWSWSCWPPATRKRRGRRPGMHHEPALV